MSVFEVLAKRNDEGIQARSRSILAARVRAQESFGSFLAKATSAQEKDLRMDAIDEDLQKIVREASEEYGHDNLGEIYTSARSLLACTCGDFGKKCDKECECKECHGTKEASGKPWEDEEEEDPDDTYGEQKERHGPWDDEEDDEPTKKDSSIKEANQYIEERDGKWVITQKGTGKVLSTHDSEDKAKASFAAMEAHKHGADESFSEDAYDLNREKLPKSDGSGLGDTGAVPTDESKVPNEGLKPIDVPSNRHPHEIQEITDHADYNDGDFDPSSPTRDRVNIDTTMQSEHNVAPNTDTWTGTEGFADPVTSAIAKYTIVS